jgi:GT2 family glycosyltransferase
VTADDVARLERLSVLIVSWNGRRHLEDCLPALLAERAEAGCEVEVLVLDNGSADGTAAWLAERHPEVVAVRSPDNVGFAAGNNRLAEAATGDVLVLLNNDTRPEPGFLSAYARAWERAPSDVGAIAGRLVDWEGLRLDFGRGVATFDGHAFALDQGRPLAAARCPEDGEELLFACGGNLSVRRRSFLEAGGFDESYFAYFEDVDLGWRLWAGGERIVAAPRASARHRSAASSDRLGEFRRGALFERNALLTVAKNAEDGFREQLLPVVLLTFLARLRAMGPPIPPAGRLAGARSALAARLRRWLDRLDPTGAAGARLGHPQAAAQLGGLGGFLDALGPLESERRRLARRRRRPDREIFERFPMWIVPTYPGDEELFASPEFEAWLPRGLEYVRATLDEVILRRDRRPGRGASR